MQTKIKIQNLQHTYLKHTLPHKIDFGRAFAPLQPYKPILFQFFTAKTVE
ncbi:MAG: hypothetical protein LBH52_01220 [Puniceicoccales bacterium]|nr:hypothetical protein [Puniceicoccales bacterium]